MKPLILLGLLAFMACGCAAPNGELPADFPADVPIISGEIYSARRTTFEDGTIVPDAWGYSYTATGAETNTVLPGNQGDWIR
jgi:hypothetical protein